MRSQVGCLFARSCRRVLVSDLATAAYSGPAIRRPSYQYHCCTRRPFHGATHLLQVANDSSQSDTRPRLKGARQLYKHKRYPYYIDSDYETDTDTDTDEEEARCLDIEELDAERKRMIAYRTRNEDENRIKLLGRLFRNHGSLDVKLTLEISFMEAVEGCTKTVTFLTDMLCRTCGGTGGPRGEKPDCCRPCECLGKMLYDAEIGYETCSFCGGLGYDLKTLCVSCKGERIAKATKAVKFDLVPGVDDSETIKVQRAGATAYVGTSSKTPVVWKSEGATAYVGTSSEIPVVWNLGDLYVTIKVKGDLVFRRKKSDIHVDATIGLGQAIFGGTIQVPTLMGDVDVKVAPGTQPGQMAVIPGKGIKIKNSECHGDQYVHFNVKIPENWMERQYLIKDCLKRSREMEKRMTKYAS